MRNKHGSFLFGIFLKYLVTVNTFKRRLDTFWYVFCNYTDLHGIGNRSTIV